MNGAVIRGFLRTRLSTGQRGHLNRMPEQKLPNLAAPFTDAVESLDVLDPVGATVGRTVRTAVPEGAVKDVLSGVPIGHALHPLLTDVVIGSFVSVNLLDLLGGDRSGEARERLLAIGIAAYFPTALTGASDYSDAEEGSPAVRRSGLDPRRAQRDGARLLRRVPSSPPARPGRRQVVGCARRGCPRSRRPPRRPPLLRPRGWRRRAAEHRRLTRRRALGIYGSITFRGSGCSSGGAWE